MKRKFFTKVFEDTLLQYTDTEKTKEYALQHMTRFLETMLLIPKHPRLEILDIGSFIPLVGALRKHTPHNYVLHGIWQGDKTCDVFINKEKFTLHNFDVEKDRFPFGDEVFDMLLCCEVIEHLGADPMFMIAEINRVLKNGGLLLLTTPNAISLKNVYKIMLGYSPHFYASFNLTRDRHNREYAPNEIFNLLDIGGFECVKIYSRDVYGDMERKKIRQIIVLVLGFFAWCINRNRSDCLFVLARKVSDIRDRYPVAFYDINTTSKSKS